MADDIRLSAGTNDGSILATDEVVGATNRHFPKGKVVFGADGTATDVTASAGLPVQQQTGHAFAVTDDSGSLTVDAPVATPVFVRLSDGGAAITALPVTDNGGSLTVDGSLTSVGTVTTVSTVETVQTVSTVATVETVTGTVTVTGSVTASALTPGTGATNLGKAEDAAHASGDTGVAVLAVRRDAAAVGSGTDGDYSTFNVDASGALWVRPSDVVDVAGTVDAQPVNAADWGVYAEDTAHTTGDSGTPVLAVRRDSAAVGSGTDGDYSTLNVDSSGRLWCNVANTVTVGSHAVTNAGTFAVQVTSLPASTNTLEVVGDAAHDAAAAGNPVLLGAYASASAPTDVSADGDVVRLWAGLDGKLHVNAHIFGVDTAGSGSVPVAHAGDLSVVNSGTFAVQATVAAGATTIAKAEDAAHASGDVGVPALAVRRDSAAVGSGADGDYSTLNVDSSGRLWCNVANTVTVGSHAVTNAGTFAVQVDGSALTALQLIDNTIVVDDAAFTPATTSVNMAGFQADETSTDSVDEGDAGAARMTLDRKIIVTPQPHAAGGLSIFRSLDLDESEEEVKASAGTVYGCWVTNTATSTRWLKFYNATAANVTVGTTTPVITIGIPGNSSDDISANFGPGGMGFQFDTAISVAATTGVADNDTGAPSANDLIVNIFYK